MQKNKIYIIIYRKPEFQRLFFDAEVIQFNLAKALIEGAVG